MKLTPLLPVMLVALAVAGCKHTESSKPAAGASATKAAPAAGDISTAALLDAFKTADASTIQMVQSAASAIGNRNWSSALSSLQKIQKIPGLTAPQDAAVKSLITSVSAK